MEVPEVKFARSGNVNLAYQRWGSGPDVVMIPPLVENIEIAWEHELYRRSLEHFGSYIRTLQFDKRGIGMSDRFDTHPTLEQRIGDITAVMDAEGIERASLVGLSEGGLMAQLFAAMHPERVDRLVLINSAPGSSAMGHLARYSDKPLPTIEDIVKVLFGLVDTWSRQPEYMVEWFMPSQRDNASFVRWVGRLQRMSASPADIRRQIESVLQLDAVAHLSQIKAPTMVMQVAGDRLIPVAAGRYLADKIPGAEYVEFEGDDHFLWVMPNWREMNERWIEFATGSRCTDRNERRFATIGFTDIVDSTRRSREVGDEAWRITLESHDRIVWKTVERHRGRVVKSLGDGVMLTFDVPSTAVACADELRRELAGIGLPIRCGIHAGEVEFRKDGDVAGLAVSLAARVGQAARDGAVFVSSTVRDLLLGSDRTFESRGDHTLKGVEGNWHLYEVVR
jgi:class 3 adenylate cyclase